MSRRFKVDLSTLSASRLQASPALGGVALYKREITAEAKRRGLEVRKIL